MYFTLQYIRLRACLKNALRKMCVTICGRFCSDEGVVAGYDNRIRTKYTAKWDVQIAGMIFQIRSKVDILQGKIHCNISITVIYAFFLLLFSDSSELWRASV